MTEKQKYTQKDILSLAQKTALRERVVYISQKTFLKKLFILLKTTLFSLTVVGLTVFSLALVMTIKDNLTTPSFAEATDGKPFSSDILNTIKARLSGAFIEAGATLSNLNPFSSFFDSQDTNVTDIATNIDSASILQPANTYLAQVAGESVTRELAAVTTKKTPTPASKPARTTPFPLLGEEGIKKPASTSIKSTTKPATGSKSVSPTPSSAKATDGKPVTTTVSGIFSLQNAARLTNQTNKGAPTLSLVSYGNIPALLVTSPDGQQLFSIASDGATTLNNTLAVGKQIQALSGLISKSLIETKSLSVLDGGATIAGALSAKDTVINGSLTVSGSFNPASISTSFISARSINATGPIVGSSLNAPLGSFTNLSSQNASFGGNANDTFKVNGTATFSSPLTAQGTLNVTGAATMASTLSVTGATSLTSLSASSLNVSGATVLSGSLGIGTSTPGALLGVAGSGIFDGSLTAYNGFTGATLTATSTTATSTLSTGGLAIGTNQFVVQQTSGRVGIGTSTPSSILHVLSSAVSPQIALGYNQTNYYTTAISSTGQVTFARFGSALNNGFTFQDTLQVATSSTQTILSIINSNTTNSTSTLAVYQQGRGPSAIFMGGKVGIGSSTPDSLLSIKATYRQATSTVFHITGDQNQHLLSVYESGAIDIGGMSSTTPANRLTVYSGGANMLQILNTGSILLGTTASTSKQFKLALDGSVNFNGSLSLGNKLNYLSYLASDGTVATSTKISDAENGGPSGLGGSDLFGNSVANIGDLDGDGITDLAVGAFNDENVDGGEGAVHILFMNANGTATSTVKISDSLNGGPSGLNAGDFFGYSVANIGDLDGDGVADLAVGAYADEATSSGSSAEGAVHILFMNANGTAKSTVKISDAENGGPVGLDASDNFGWSVANIGDLDGDGVTDLAVGAYADEATASGSADEGALHILFMNPNGTVKSTVKISDSENGGPVGLDANDFFGYSVANLGDLDGDGVIDLAVGAYWDEATSSGSSAEGAVHILFMNANGTVKSSVKISDSENGGPLNLDASDQFGSSVAFLGDLNGDGINDLAVGATGDEATSSGSSAEGAVHILFMNANGTAKSTVKISDAENGGPVGLDASDSFGSAVANIGDLDGDGITDLAVGASADEATASGDANEGALFILRLTNTSRLRLATAGSERLSANSLGTVNIKRNLEIGETASSTPAFRISVIASGDPLFQLLSTGSARFGLTASTSKQFRLSVQGPMNVYGALALGDKRNYLSYLSGDGTVASSTKISDAENGGPSSLDASDFFGTSVANIGDLDGDGITDLAVGAYQDEATSAGSLAEGTLHILFMNANSTVKSTVKISDSENGGPVGLDASDYFGSSVANIGDLDGDGVIDLAVGAYQDEATSSGSSAEGAVHILFMNANGTVKSTVKISDSENGGPVGLDASDNFGYSITNIGDLDGDGITDLAVGAWIDEATAAGDASEGAVHILFMNSNGTAKSTVKISDSENGGPIGLDASDVFGTAVANVGDLDGDGITDLAVGAFNDEASGSGGEGAVHILFMNSNGTVKSTTKISTALNGGPVDLGASDRFGSSIANIGDLNGDGVTDLAVGARDDEATSGGTSSEGALHILFMNTNGTVKSKAKISDSESGGPVGLDDSDKFGSAVASIGDLDGDGITDLAVGAYQDEATGSADTSEGSLFILRMTNASKMRLVTGGYERLVVTAGGNFNIFGTASSTMALSVVQSGAGDLLALKNHLPGATTLSVKSSPNELSAIIVVKSSLEIRQKSAVIWTAKSAWDAPDVGSYSRPVFADLDNDGDLDLLIGETGGTSKGYENTGSVSSPVWTAKTAWNIPDVGDYATPAVADLDNDSDYDVLIGDATGVSFGYENTGTVSNPTWTAKTAWNTVVVGIGWTRPNFADLDNDGDYDLLIGDAAGISYGYENTGTVSSPTWTAKTAWNVTDVGSQASPAFADLDNDGDYDLLIGEQITGISYGYENTGTVSSPVWTAKTAWNTAGVGGYARPAFADLDNDGDYDLLIGETSGVSYAYENTGATASTFFAKNGSVGIGTSTPSALLHVDAGTAATSVLEVGDQYSTGVSGSKTCFNVKNAAGAAVSFYIGPGNTVVVEASRCR